MMQLRSLSVSTVALAAALLAAGALAAAQDTTVRRPRSVLFCLVDTCRGDRMGFEGYERETTPFLSELAERSVVFENCSSQAAWTKPSMASMLTSQYPSTTGIYRMDQRLPHELVTWPEVLREHGLYTAGFSANIVMGNALSDLAQGFEHFVESTAVNRGDPIRFASGSARKLNEHVFDWLERTDHWPQLLYVHSVDPHEEYEPEPEYLQHFADPSRHASFREEWRALLDSRPPIPGLYVTQDNFDATGIDSVSFIRHSSDLYDADVAANDDQLAALYERLAADGWGDDLILIVTSDHGEEFFDHGGTSHGYSLYEEMVGVPLLIHAPGLVPEGLRVSAPVRSLDVFPTLCELLGIAPPDGLEGRSLVPLMHGEEASERPVFSEHREDPILRRIGQGSGNMLSLRRGRWKLIRNELSSQLLEKPPVELFDLEADPGERVNVADEHPDVVARLQAEIDAFVARREERAHVAEAAEIDPAALEELRALGYVGDDEEDDAGALPIWEALAAWNITLIRASLEAGANPDELEPSAGITPLTAAVGGGNRELVELLLEAGATVDLRNRDGGTALGSAAFFGRVDLLELLLERGADPSIRNYMGDTALSATEAPWNVTKFVADMFGIPVEREAVEAGRLRCAAILRAATEPQVTPETRLFCALGQGDAAAAAAALDDGASPRALDPRTGWTPLTMAVITGHHDLARLLLERGARVTTRNRDMGTTLHAAAATGDVEALELLLAHGADPDARDARASTPLHAAAFLGRADAVRALLRGGADLAMTDADGRTPLESTRIDWETTRTVIAMLGMYLSRDEVTTGRDECARLLAD